MKAYKIVRKEKNKLYSAVVEGELMKEYIINKETKGNCLCCFLELSQAKDFQRKILNGFDKNYDCTIFMAEVIKERIQKVKLFYVKAYSRTITEIINPFIPKGTIFCESVKLLREEK